MQKLIDALSRHPQLPEPARWNLCREVLQTLVLKSIFASPAGRSLVFQGGTCLRLCHQLKRYSEDLDFSLIEKTPGYSFQKLHQAILRDLARQGFDAGGSSAGEKVVQKAFVRIAGLPRLFGFSVPEDQKLGIKIEVDTRPPAEGRRESFFVSRWGELFPILKYDLPTLFAGKALALLFRPYDRGRDYYDLIWFMGQKIRGNAAYFQAGAAQAGGKTSVKTWEDVLKEVGEKADRVSSAALLRDLRPFLEDPTDAAWLGRYQEVFHQLLREQPTQRTASSEPGN
jgi:predicted nucleotidyltransferase component of viral defense system